MAEPSSFQILEPGLQTTVQDLGRPGFMRVGVSPGGALDRAALVLGNRLVANEPGAAGLEITLLGPRLRFSAAAVVALSGADLCATVNGAAVPRWEPFAVGAGDELAFAVPCAEAGARAYLCLAGGVAVEPMMGSRSTDLFAGFGGWRGRALAAGDELLIGSRRAPIGELLRRRLAGPSPTIDRGRPVRVVLGPQAERFTGDGIETFLGSAYAVSAKSDRMGLRLAGPAVALRAGADLVSEGIAHGAVQVPGDGQPILLLAARQTIGGYPKIATAIGADLDGLGQRRPGDPVRFAEVDLAEARDLALAYHGALGDAAVTVASRTAPGWSLDTTRGSGQSEAMSDAWSPTAVARLVENLRGAGVASFRLEIAGAGLKLDVDWWPGAPRSVESTGNAFDSAARRPASPLLLPRTEDDNIVKAPLLGVFFRRPAPDQAPFVEEGQRIDAGQPVGLIEVMKTYHEVTTPRSGVLAAFMVEEGATVEYGQAIARLDP